MGDVLACVACLRDQRASMGDASGVPAWLTYRSRYRGWCVSVGKVGDVLARVAY